MKPTHHKGTKGTEVNTKDLNPLIFFVSTSVPLVPLW